VFNLLTSLAQARAIPFQINALGYPASNDAAVIQLARGGCATGLVTIPNRYMHSPVELVSESDLEHCAALLAAFCLAVDEETRFVP
jgi:endoglucanase